MDLTDQEKIAAKILAMAFEYQTDSDRTVEVLRILGVADAAKSYIEKLRLEEKTA
jgi:hypothetical protein